MIYMIAAQYWDHEDDHHNKMIDRDDTIAAATASPVQYNDENTR